MAWSAKPGGGERPLGIPTIRDRVVQTAVVLLLEPIFEADFEDNVYAYRPERSAHDALAEVQERLYGGQAHVVDADVTKYFDTIPAPFSLRRTLLFCFEHGVNPSASSSGPG